MKPHTQIRHGTETFKRNKSTVSDFACKKLDTKSYQQWTRVFLCIAPGIPSSRKTHLILVLSSTNSSKVTMLTNQEPSASSRSSIHRSQLHCLRTQRTLTANLLVKSFVNLHFLSSYSWRPWAYWKKHVQILLSKTLQVTKAEVNAPVLLASRLPNSTQEERYTNLFQLGGLGNERKNQASMFVVADNHWHTISTKYIPRTVLKTRNKHTSALQITTSNSS